jgi:two-component system response regulator (stage 0 sporulation protein A)
MGHIYDVLKTLGIRRTYKGYYYLADAIHLVMDDASLLLYISKSLYPEVARRNHTTMNCVERNIRTVINHCWCGENIDTLEEMAGIALSEKPTSGEFIDILSSYLMSENYK